MKILVTGGTGFVGSHSVAALARDGHDLRLLARSADRVAPALDPHNVTITDIAVGDVTDRAAVTSAMEGCDAVLHAANVFTLDPRRVAQMKAVNETGTELLLSLAVKAGLDPIVHVSSLLALLPSSDDPIMADSATGSPRPPYAATKAVGDRIAVGLQNEGAPVVITRPGFVFGPDDPYIGESAATTISALKGQMRLLNDGPVPMTDVRDVADVHAAVMEPGRGPRRYLVAGHSPDFRSLIGEIGHLTGRNLWSLKVPHGMALATGRLFDWLLVRFGLKAPIGYEAPWLVANGGVADGSAVTVDLGVKYRPLEETLTDTVRWLHEAGHISDKLAGRLTA